jgi:hypothetical protein
MQKASLLRHAQWIVLTALLLGPVTAEERAMATRLESLSPLRTIEIRIDANARELLVEQMRKFADTFGFTARIEPSSPDSDDVFFQMWRQDVDLLGARTSKKRAPGLTFTFGVFPKRFQPVPPPANVDLLVEGLRQFIGQVRSVTIIQTK